MFFRCSDDVQTAPTEAVFGTPNHYRNVSALIGACQLLKRGLFNEIGGYDERSLIACSDVILCLGASRLGYRNFYTPYAALIHHEGSTRGRSNPGDDILLLGQSLRDLDCHEDPFFHPELDPAHANPAVRATWVETSSAHLRRRIEEMTAFEPGRELTTLGSDWSARAALRNLPDHSSSRSSPCGGRRQRHRVSDIVRDRPASPRRRLSTSVPAGPFRGRGRRFLQLALLRGDRPPWPAPRSCSDNPRRIRFPTWLSGQPVDRLSGTRESAFSDRPHAPSARRAGHLAFPTWEQTRHLQPASLVVLARKRRGPDPGAHPGLHHQSSLAEPLPRRDEPPWMEATYPLAAGEVWSRCDRLRLSIAFAIKADRGISGSLPKPRCSEQVVARKPWG